MSLPSSNDVGGDAECSDSAAGEHDERSNSGVRSGKSTGSGEAYSKQVLGFVGWWKSTDYELLFSAGAFFQQKVDGLSFEKDKLIIIKELNDDMK